MKITIAAIGKLKSGPEKVLAEDYTNRIVAMGRKAGIKSLVIKDWNESQKADCSARLAEEESHLWSQATKAAHVIVLDERGKSCTSEQFATKLRKLLDQGESDIAFLLGGPDGHSQATRQKAGETLALGPMTWPHRMARIMLLEQIYRSVTIMLNHPYHRA